MEIQKTSDYKIFNKLKENRRLHKTHVKLLKKSISINNLLHFMPILVDKDYQVIDGQHRLEAAKELGVPIYFHVRESSGDGELIQLNDFVRKWSLEDYCNYYSNRGEETYKKIVKFCEDEKISVNYFLCFCVSRNGNSTNEFKQGYIKFNFDKAKENYFKAKDLIDTIINFHISKPPTYLKSRTFSRAMVKVVNAESINFKDFKEKITTNMSKLRQCSTIADYLDIFLAIYNHRRQYKVNL